MARRSEHGQATIEHLGVVALIALVMLGTGAIAAVAAPGLFNRVSGGVQHALCVVTGKRCEGPDDEPCPVRRQTDRSSQTLGVAWLRLGHDRVLHIERRSDGTYVLSLLEGARAGAGIGRGVGGGNANATTDANLTLGWKGGRQYTAATAAEARALVRRLRADPVPALATQVAAAGDLTGLRDADRSVDAYVLSGDAAAEAVARLGFGPILDGGADVASSQELGVKIAAHRQELTLYIKADAKISAFYDALSQATITRRGRTPESPAPAPPAPSGKPDLTKRPAEPDTPPPPSGPERQGQAIDASPTKPLEGTVNGTIALRFAPGPRLLGAEVVISASTATRQREFRAQLDPADPAVAAAIERWKRAPADLQALRALGEAAADRAALDDRTFALTDDKRVRGLAGQAPSGAAAVALTDERAIALLTDQRSRPSGGLWETRLDCMTLAATG
ncbi:MAG: hypothetical protein JHD16_04945 [Solirubrobacteraceae bacterium]|nr:hypothetical protein [Solirubrobacteraceae bacterium]